MQFIPLQLKYGPRLTKIILNRQKRDGIHAKNYEYEQGVAASPPIVVAPVLSVGGVPGVGDVNGHAAPVRAGEVPAPIERNDLAHKITPYARNSPESSS